MNTGKISVEKFSCLFPSIILKFQLLKFGAASLLYYDVGSMPFK